MYLPKFRTVKSKFFLFTAVILITYLFIIYLFFQVWILKKYKHDNRERKVSLPNIIVHLDFKGAPPNLHYLKWLLPLLKSYGVTGFLMEYEDMFPYKGDLVNISARNAYSAFQLRKFLKHASKQGFLIIPLIQTLGHMEHVLKLNEFKHLREVERFPDSICPRNAESQELIKAMLFQVIEFHKTIQNLKYIHIGCDEVFHLGKCKQCQDGKRSKRDIIEDHISFVWNIIEDLSPDTTVLIWDDMFRDIMPIDIHRLDAIQPVIWSYEPKITVTHINMFNYHKHFGGMWIASAFKGADGSDSLFPSLRTRLQNHHSWLKFIGDYTFQGEDEPYKFQGIILTGWSRYSHMDTLCDLLPVSVPSLMLNLILIDKFTKGDANVYGDDLNEIIDGDLYDKFTSALRCPKVVMPIDNFNTSKCKFSEASVYDILKRFELLKSNIYSFLNNDFSSLELKAKAKNINVNYVEEQISACHFKMLEVLEIEKLMTYNLKMYYNNDTIVEIVNFKTFPLKLKLRNVLNILNNYYSITVWERRPVKMDFWNESNFSLISF